MVCAQLCGQQAATAYFSSLRIKHRHPLWTFYSSRVGASIFLVFGAVCIKNASLSQMSFYNVGILMLLSSWLISKYWTFSVAFILRVRFLQRDFFFNSTENLPGALWNIQHSISRIRHKGGERIKAFCTSLHGREMQLHCRRTDKGLSYSYFTKIKYTLNLIYLFCNNAYNVCLGQTETQLGISLWAVFSLVCISDCGCELRQWLGPFTRIWDDFG